MSSVSVILAAVAFSVTASAQTTSLPAAAPQTSYIGTALPATNLRPSSVVMLPLYDPTYGSQMGVDARVTPLDATGRITFFVDGVPAGSGPVAAGRVVVPLVMSMAGKRRIIAVYSGDTLTAPSTSDASVVWVGNVRATLLRLVPSPGISGFSTIVTLADLNGDGKADLVTASGPYVNVALGNGDGTFGLPARYDTGAAIVAMTVADFNADGKADAAINTGGQLRFLFGNGDGTLAAAAVPAVVISSGPIAVSDFNGDGRLDIAVGGSGAVQILLGNGDGTFQTPASVSFPVGTARALTVGDFNGDGRFDIAVAADSGCFFLAGVGDGTFLSATILSQTPSAGVTAGDWNSDGRTDLAFSTSGFVIVLLAQNGGSFQLSTSILRAAGAIWPVDFNGDGKLDLLVPEGNGVAVLCGLGDGTFQFPADFLTLRMTPSSIAVGDLNGDGRADVALGYSTYNDVLVELGAIGFISRGSGSEQGALTGTTFSAPLVAVVTDGTAPIPGVYVTFFSPVSGASAWLDFVGTPTVYTDANGAVSVSAKANNVGGIYSVGVMSGLAGAAFTLNNIDPSAASVAPVSVSPAGGGGSSQTFAALFTASNGYRDLKWVQLLFATYPGSGQSYCFVHYDVQGNAFWLYGDGGFFIGPETPGAASNQLQNGFCALNTSASTISWAGTTLTVHAAIVFKQGASRNVWMRAMNQSETDIGWVMRGEWTPAAAATGTASVTPTSGAGLTQTFTATYPDPPGFAGATFGWVQFLVAAASDGGGQPFCFVHYDRGGNALWMYSSDVGFFLGPVTPGTASTALNSSACSVNTASATVTNTGGNLVLSVPIMMKAPMSGAKKIFQRTLDTMNRDTGWQQTGTWTVP